MAADPQELATNMGGQLDVVLDLRNEAILRQVEIIGEREGGLIDCWVPMDLVDNEEVPVKEDHAISLAEQMGREIEDAEGEGTGQLTPITLGLIEGEDKLKIIDGFHRSAALDLRSEKQVYATVKRTDWNGLYDDRIFMAKDHTQVRFSRVVQWIREVWEFSGLQDKLSVEQAVLLFRYESNGAKLGLDPADVEAAKSWVERKEKQWDIAAMTIHSHLKVAENVDPRLVHDTREKKSEHALEAPTQVIIKAFSDFLPKQFDMQSLVMDVAKARNLTGAEVRGICHMIKGLPDTRTAEQAIGKIDWANWKPVYSKTKTKALRRAHDPRQKGAEVLSKAGHEIDLVIERVDLSVERGEEITDPMRDNIRAAQARVDEMTEKLGTLGVKLSELLGEKPKPVARPARETAKFASKTSVRRPTRSEDQDLSDVEEPDLSEMEDGPDADDVIGDEDEYPAGSLDDDYQSRTGIEWDEEASGYEEDDEEPEFAPEPSKVIKTAPAPAADGEAKTNALAEKFEKGIRDYLNGLKENPPLIKNRLHISRAEQMLIKGSFSGDPALREDLREEIAIARRRLSEGKHR